MLKIHKKKKEKLRLEAMVREGKNLTFKPNITSRKSPVVADRNEALSQASLAKEKKSSKSSQRRTSRGNELFERLHQERKGVQELRDEIKKKMDLKGCTFAPKVERRRSGVPKVHSKTKSSGSNIWDRLSSLDDKEEKYRKLEAKREELELKECTFAPKRSMFLERLTSESKSSAPVVKLK